MNQEPRALMIKELRQIPGVGPSIANDLVNIGITRVSDLKNQDPEWLYHQSNNLQESCRINAFSMCSDALYTMQLKINTKKKS
jgi:predicted flap endonuclease-1-like 5' DNA nuclease